MKQEGTVLVVDDYAPVRDAVRSALEEEFGCLSAGSAAEGLEILQTHPVDAVILDICMPEMDGIEALKRIREMGIGVPVIFLTGHGSLDTAQKAVRYGAFDYLTKPFQMASLQETVKEAVEKKRLQGKRGKDDELEKLARSLGAKLADASRLARRSEVSSEALTELKNPLTAILGYTQMLLRKLRDRRIRLVSPKSLRYLATIEEEAKTCVEIASKLASVSGQTPSLDGAKINEVLPNATSLLRPQCSLGGIEIRTTLLKEDAVVDVPSDDLHAVLVNLILNSMESMKGPGEINIRGYRMPQDSLLLNMASQAEKEFLDLSPEKFLVAIEVSDTGRGIDPQHLDKIFDLFFTTKTDRPGAGIGLALCKEKVELGGGRVGVVRSGPEGSTMRILLPVSKRV